GDGPVPVAPGGEGQGSLLEVSRTRPEQREFPVTGGQRVAVGARRVHVLPTPVSSFTAVGETQAAARALHDSPLLSTLGVRMHTRVAMRTGRGERAPPGVPAVATGPGSAAQAEWHLRHGAAQLLCVPLNAPLPTHVVIHILDREARAATVPVAASLLRHIPAEATYLAIHPAAADERQRAERMRELLDARSGALADHGLDMRTELRSGEMNAELERELARRGDSMLVLGTSDPGRIDWSWLGGLLESRPERPVLIVNAARAAEG
ncbi:MAG TPA: universal stress protein, partial [Steroidobacteraceae bacterium]|nr:universal stress protein [Steroidobacteraceae bacterium]